MTELGSHGMESSDVPVAKKAGRKPEGTHQWTENPIQNVVQTYAAEHIKSDVWQ